MNIQAQVAARRAELARAETEAKAESDRARHALLEAERAQRQEALDAIAGEMSLNGVELRRVGDDLEIAHPDPVPFDVKDLKRSSVDRLLKREARKMWSPAENWQVIAPIVAGVFALFLIWWAGLLLLLIGFARSNSVNSRYRTRLREQYPDLFVLSRPPATGSAPGEEKGDA